MFKKGDKVKVISMKGESRNLLSSGDIVTVRSSGASLSEIVTEAGAKTIVFNKNIELLEMQMRLFDLEEPEDTKDDNDTAKFISGQDVVIVRTPSANSALLSPSVKDGSVVTVKGSFFCNTHNRIEYAVDCGGWEQSFIPEDWLSPLPPKNKAAYFVGDVISIVDGSRKLSKHFKKGEEFTITEVKHFHSQDPLYRCVSKQTGIATWLGEEYIKDIVPF